MTDNLRKISADKLKQVLEEHALWIESNGKKGKSAILRGVDLSNCDFYRVDFFGATLRESSFRNASLLSTNFIGADTRDCDFTGAIPFYGYKLIKNENK